MRVSQAGDREPSTQDTFPCFHRYIGWELHAKWNSQDWNPCLSKQLSIADKSLKPLHHNSGTKIVLSKT